MTIAGLYCEGGCGMKMTIGTVKAARDYKYERRKLIWFMGFLLFLSKCFVYRDFRK